jgi:LEA14-like dessication related protein
MRRIKYGLLPLAVLVLAACASLESVVHEPSISVDSVEITGFSFSGLDMVCHVNVENLNGFDIPFPKVDWDLFINSNEFIRGTIKNDTHIKARQTVTVDIPFSVTYAGLFNSFKSLIDAKEAAYNIKLALTFALPIIQDKTFNLDFAGVIPIVRMPSLSFKGIAVKSLGMRKLDFVLTWEVDNPNSFSFGIDKFLYDFKVNNNSWAQGSAENSPTIKADGKTTIPVDFTVSALSMVTDIISIISGGKQVAYNCTGDFSLLGDLPGLAKLDLPFSFSGNTKISN